MCTKDKPGSNIMKDRPLSLLRTRKQVKALLCSAALCACKPLTSDCKCFGNMASNVDLKQSWCVQPSYKKKLNRQYSCWLCICEPKHDKHREKNIKVTRQDGLFLMNTAEICGKLKMETGTALYSCTIKQKSGKQKKKIKKENSQQFEMPLNPCNKITLWFSWIVIKLLVEKHC